MEYTKQPITLAEQIDILKQRGLMIGKGRAKNTLLHLLILRQELWTEFLIVNRTYVYVSPDGNLWYKVNQKGREKKVVSDVLMQKKAENTFFTLFNMASYL